jgi:hypothetical protein
MLKDALRYELPPQGITLLGYIVRRLHKTDLLMPVPDLLANGHSSEALARVAGYAVAASTSFGPAFYQPVFDAPGDEVSETDPATGARVSAKLEATRPHYVVSSSVILPDGSTFETTERITGTTVSLRGLGMPAPSVFHYRSGDYTAQLAGTLTSELALSLFGRTRIRAHGFLNLSDSARNTGKAMVDRAGRLIIEVNGREMALTEAASTARSKG